MTKNLIEFADPQNPTDAELRALALVHTRRAENSLAKAILSITLCESAGNLAALRAAVRSVEEFIAQLERES